MEPEVIVIEDDDVEPLWIGFINCGKKNMQSAIFAYRQLKERSNNWVLGLNDVNYRQLKDLISDANVHFFFANGRNKVALLASREYWELNWAPNELDMVSIRNASMRKGLMITCALLSRPKSTLSLIKKEKMFESYCNMVKLYPNHHQVLMGDVNSCSYTWTMDNTDSIGKSIADLVIDLCFENVLTSTYHNWTRFDPNTGRKSWIDAIFVDDKLNKNLSKAAAIDLFEVKQRMILTEIKGENICEPFKDSESIKAKLGITEPSLPFGEPRVKKYREALEKMFVITEAHRVPKIVFLNQIPITLVARYRRVQNEALQRYSSQMREKQRRYSNRVFDLRFLCRRSILLHNKKTFKKFFDYTKNLATNEAIK